MGFCLFFGASLKQPNRGLLFLVQPYLLQPRSAKILYIFYTVFAHACMLCQAPLYFNISISYFNCHLCWPNFHLIEREIFRWVTMNLGIRWAVKNRAEESSKQREKEHFSVAFGSGCKWDSLRCAAVMTN